MVAQPGVGWGSAIPSGPMGEDPKTRRKPIRTGLGILLLVLGGHSIHTTLVPSRGMLRPDNAGELGVMLVVGQPSQAEAFS